MLTMQKLLNWQDGCCFFSHSSCIVALGHWGKARRQDIFLFSFYHSRSRQTCEMGNVHLSPLWSGPSYQWPFLDGWGNLRSAPRWEALSVPTPGPRGCCWAREPWRVSAWGQTGSNIRLEPVRTFWYHHWPPSKLLCQKLFFLTFLNQPPRGSKEALNP